MAVYTVYALPAANAAGSTAVEQFVFVEEHMPWLAFIAPPLWMIWHKLWLATLLYIVVTGLVSTLFVVSGAGQGVTAIVNLLVSFLFALEAPALWQWTLRRKGYRHVASVVADRQEHAELKFFAGTMQNSAANPAKDTAIAQILGLFPESVRGGTK
jgi:hypothetical protein